MIMGLYTLKDRVSEETSGILLQKNDNTACRTLRAEIEKNPQMAEDLMLYYLGTYDTESMEISSERPRLVPFEVVDGS